MVVLSDFSKHEQTDPLIFVIDNGCSRFLVTFSNFFDHFRLFSIGVRHYSDISNGYLTLEIGLFSLDFRCYLC